MESRDELKEIVIKNCMCYYIDDIRKASYINSSNILVVKKIYILIYNISCKTFIGSIPLCISLDKIDGFYKVYDGVRYLLILGDSWSDEICDSIKYM